MWLLPPIKKVSVFSPNTGKYGPEITPYLDTFYPVKLFRNIENVKKNPWVRISALVLMQPACDD